MPKVRKHRSSRRAPGPKDSDFDHEINLVDRDDDETSLRPSSAGPASSRPGTAPPSAEPVAADGEGVSGGEGREENAGQPSVAVEGEQIYLVRVVQPNADVHQSPHRWQKLLVPGPRTRRRTTTGPRVPSRPSTSYTRTREAASSAGYRSSPPWRSATSTRPHGPTLSTASARPT